MGFRQLTEEGDFRVRVYKYGLWEAKSKAVAVNMDFEVLEAYDHEGQTWIDWRGEDVFVGGAFWIVGKDGAINERQVESLVEHCGWNALMSDITAGTWKPTDCQVTVKKEEYQGNVRYKASFINAYDAQPGGRSNVTADAAKSMDQSYGASLRALAANAKAKKKPNGKPSSPSKPAPTSTEEAPWDKDDAATVSA